MGDGGETEEMLQIFIFLASDNAQRCLLRLSPGSVLWYFIFCDAGSACLSSSMTLVEIHSTISRLGVIFSQIPRLHRSLQNQVRQVALHMRTKTFSFCETVPRIDSAWILHSRSTTFRFSALCRGKLANARCLVSDRPDKDKSRSI